jgi:transposase InsO family protein
MGAALDPARQDQGNGLVSATSVPLTNTREKAADARRTVAQAPNSIDVRKRDSVIQDFSQPVKPADNAFIESFNARVRPEYLNQHWFLDLDDARTKIELWR